MAVWQISEEDERNLDIYEGFPKFYFKQNVYVTLQDGSKRKAMVYIMNKFARPGKPSTTYINIIKEGYFDNDLNLSHLCKSIQKKRRRNFLKQIDRICKALQCIIEDVIEYVEG